MTQDRHTQGPWEVSFEDVIQIKTKKDYFIGEVYNINKYPENIANARLIAAAPELLEALEDIYKRGYEMSQHEMVRAAIAKARGQS